MASNNGESAPAVVWFRDDLRIADNPALVAATKADRPILPVYLFDEASPGLRSLGGASRWWLHHSLASLKKALAGRGAELRILAGAALEAMPRLIMESGARSIFWNRRFVPALRMIDDELQALLEDQGVEVRNFNGTLGREPDEVRPKAGGWYRVYAPYWRAAEALGPLPDPAPTPGPLRASTHVPSGTVPLASLRLLPTAPDWSGGLAASWTPGETQAQKLLARFVETGLSTYAERRAAPGLDGSSRLSAHLRFGEVSPRQIAAAVRQATRTKRDVQLAQKFLQELAWRDFSCSLLTHVPELATRAFSPRFAQFAWLQPDPAMLSDWQHGRTGYPIVDAGMRQLWQTGWMHNRVRMITASFLVKDLLIDWRRGEDWFWDTLCDADPANNAVNWQWVAGTGPDAAPFFRIFNPVLQGEKFDPGGTYVRCFVPELRELPDRFIHRPWEAPGNVLRNAGVQLGETYPAPIVDHGKARERALAAFRAAGPAPDR